MKTKNSIRAALAVIIAVAVTAFIPVNLSAQEKGSGKGGAQGLMKPIKTAQDAEAVAAGDTVVMACPKCKTISYNYVDKTARGATKETKVGAKHGCPGCETAIKTTGTGKQATDAIVHVCKTCGSEDAFCCVMKKGSGPTKGMEKK